ncbi:serine/threonine-protein kinase [Nocardiopsis sp. L17-MgMaSL7]|uniref:serine/threonine-protein kinase n=1 Tax=Nocardiopsis sp. L17-MgMaSL7 TaxID=1938893 RepID=UPI000D892ADD|nr:serine/threonine-protein kinase [Nocardiopsis sp. L17-MgMaSL7]PWV51018.1 serine/threonine protein kinase [Nocardiopsis sp. L17-MgMaSL7]
MSEPRVTNPHPAPGFAPLRPDDPESLGGFRVVGRIGTGGMGTVYAGLRRCGGSRDGYTAIKVIREELTEDPDFRARFTREVRVLGRVRSRSVPRFLGSGQDADGPWLATEFVPGLTLSAYVRRHGPLPPNLLLGLAAGVAEALQAVHAAGVVHRDLKPGNVVLAPDGPKVLDFGIARAVDETALTRTGGLVGTPGWIAPEVLRGSAAAPPADLFAWGALVAHAATGRPPFGSEPTDSLALRALDRVPDLTGVPAPLLPLVAAALSPDPGQRPTAAGVTHALVTLGGRRSPAPDAAAVRMSVGALLDREWRGVRAVPPPPPRRVSRALVAGGAAVLLLCAVGGGTLAARTLSTDAEVNGEDTATATAEPDEDPGEGARTAGAEWVMPEPTPFGTNAEWLAEAITSSNGLPTFQATPDDHRTLFHLSVASIEQTPEGVRFTLLVENLVDGHGAAVAEQFTVPTPEGPIHPEETPGPAAVGDELVLTFPGAPARGPLTFGDPDHVPGISGIPPISQCYDAPAGSTSVEYDSCP